MNADLSALLQQMANGPANPADFDRVLDQLAAGDPLVSQLLAAMRSRRSPELLGPAGDDEPNVEPIPQGERRRRGREQLTQLMRELEELHRLHAKLAAALGACAVCWGEDPHCRDCGGSGCPGAFPIDARLFAYFVEPAVRRVQLQTNQANSKPIGTPVSKEHAP